MSQSILVSVDEQDPGLVILELRGKFSLSEEDTLTEELNKALHNLQFKQVIDLSKVKTLSKDCVKLFYLQLKRLKDEDGHLVILNPSIPALETIQNIPDGNDIFDIAIEIDEAVEMLYDPPSRNIKPYLRLHHRDIVSTSKSIVLNDDKNIEHIVLLNDISDSGFGCIYTGFHCPKVRDQFIIQSEDQHVEYDKQAQIQWVSKIGDNIYRIGMKYI